MFPTFMIELQLVLLCPWRVLSRQILWYLLLFLLHTVFILTCFYFSFFEYGWLCDGFGFPWGCYNILCLYVMGSASFSTLLFLSYRYCVVTGHLDVKREKIYICFFGSLSSPFTITLCKLCIIGHYVGIYISIYYVMNNILWIYV